jgi:hypothetical protein
VRTYGAGQLVVGPKFGSDFRMQAQAELGEFFQELSKDCPTVKKEK